MHTFEPSSSEPRPAIRIPLDALDVTIVDGPGGAIVVKDHSGPLPEGGRTADQHRAAVRRELDWLASARGIAGVVRAGDDCAGGAVVATEFAGGHTLRSACPEPVPAALMLQAVCTTLASLAERGLQHGSVAPEHVILANDGSGVLCSPNTSTDPDQRTDDLVGLGRCITFCVDTWGARQSPPENLAAWLLLAKKLEHADPTMGPLRARSTLADMCTPPAARRRRKIGVGAAIAAVVALGAWMTAGARPEVAPVTGPEVTVGNERLRVGSAGQVAVALDPPADCAGAEVYLLDPGTFWVWTFDRSERADAAEPLVRVPGATDLEVRRGGRCPTVIARGPAGTVDITEF